MLSREHDKIQTNDAGLRADGEVVDAEEAGGPAPVEAHEPVAADEGFEHAENG